MTLNDLAKIMGVSSAYLSAVETGRKNVTMGVALRVSDAIGLSETDMAELIELARRSRSTVMVEMGGVSDAKRDLAVTFAAKFTMLGESDISEIMEILARKGKKAVKPRKEWPEELPEEQT